MVAVEEEPGRFSCMEALNPDSRNLALDWQHFPSCHWKTSSQKIPFTTPSRPLTLIYAGSCFTVSKTVVVVLSARQSYLGLPACVTHIRQTQHMQQRIYLTVNWLFKAWITIRSRAQNVWLQVMANIQHTSFWYTSPHRLSWYSTSAT